MSPRVLVIGGGMITHDQILPSLLHLQRQGVVGEIDVCASRPETVRALAAAPIWQRAFPDQRFSTAPDAGPAQPALYREKLTAMPKRQIAIVATPDQLHYEMTMAALEADQHVICVKPLVLKRAQAAEIDRAAKARGLTVGVEYHKRFDYRSLMARARYRQGLFGEFILGTAALLEKWYYRHSNFQQWFTCENSDAFTYIGCHYVDLVAFITGLKPERISVYGIKDKFPNGNEGYLWTDARVIWSNGACLNVQNALGFPDGAPGTNTQGITMYFRGAENGAWLEHSDQYRGLRYSYTHRPPGDGATVFAEPSPDYFQYVDLGGPGLVPVGYGYRSIEFLVKKCIEVESSPAAERAALLARIDEESVMATPSNSSYNEAVVEAGRASILSGGREVAIESGE